MKEKYCRKLFTNKWFIRLKRLFIDEFRAVYGWVKGGLVDYWCGCVVSFDDWVLANSSLV